jgi:hypothetical protein
VNASSHGYFLAGTGAFPDPVAFKLGNARKHGHDQLASVTNSVGPGFGQRLKAGASLAYGFPLYFPFSEATPTSISARHRTTF